MHSWENLKYWIFALQLLATHQSMKGTITQTDKEQMVWPIRSCSTKEVSRFKGTNFKTLSVERILRNTKSWLCIYIYTCSYLHSQSFMFRDKRLAYNSYLTLLTWKSKSLLVWSSYLPKFNMCKEFKNCISECVFYR